MSNIIVWSELTEKQRKAILDKHHRWLRNEKGGERADLYGADLSFANLSRADLSRADLSDADLYGADLSGANLSRADLSDADLSDADLSFANLSRADLSDADLSDADLSGADLSRADLSRADLYGADLSFANLSGANGEKVKITGFYQCGPQGSRGDMLTAFSCDDGNVYFSTGCVRSMEQKEFLKRVTSTHDGNEHGKAYKAAVAHCVKMLKAQVKK